MYTFYYIDYYIIFVLVYLLLFSTISFKDYILFKGDYNVHTKMDKSKIIYFNFKIVLIFIFTYLALINDYTYKFNLVFINKFLFIYLFLFLFFFKKYAYIFKMFNFEYILLLLFSCICLMLLIQCDNFLNFYILLESYSLCFCFVIILKNPTKKLVEGSFNYLILNLVASLIILFSISYIYLSTGFINFNDFNRFIIMHDLFYNKIIMNYAFLILSIGIFIKLAIFPFSLFVLEIYKNLNIPYVFFLLTISKFILISVFTYFTNFLFLSFDVKIYSIALFFIFLTTAVHSSLCLFNNDLKSIIVNISLANTPFLVLVLFSKSIFFFVNYINFIFVYFLNLICFFSIFFLFLFNKINILKKKTSLNSLYYLNTPIFILIMINLLSLSALPPFSNFFVKLYIYYVLVEYKLIYIYIFLSFINLFIIYCFLDIIKIILIKNININLKYYKIKKCHFTFIITFISFFSLFFFLFFDLVYMLIYNSLFISVIF